MLSWDVLCDVSPSADTCHPVQRYKRGVCIKFGEFNSYRTEK